MAASSYTSASAAASTGVRPRRRTALLYCLVGALLVAVTLWYGACWTIWTSSWNSAQNSIRVRDWQAAEHQLARCRWAWPSDPETWLTSSRVARRSGDREQSQVWLDKAAQLGAREKDVRLERLLDYGQWEFSPDVEVKLNELLETNRSDYPLIAEVLSGEYMRLYRLPEAYELLNRWVEIDPNDTEPFVRRAWVEERQLDFDNALADYRRVLAMDDQRLPIRTQIAEILYKLRRPEEAIKELRIVQEEQQDDPQIAVRLSRCYRETGEHDSALEVLEALPEQSKKTPVVQAEMAHIALFTEDYAKAEALFRAALEDMPRERDALVGLHQALSQLGKTAEADEIQAVLKQVDADGRRMGEVITALTRNPADADLRFEGACIFLRNGVKEDGVRWLQMALSANPRHVAAHQRLAEYYEQEGRTDLAGVHRDILRKLESSQP